jgi:hypothetical protein
MKAQLDMLVGDKVLVSFPVSIGSSIMTILGKLIDRGEKFQVIAQYGPGILFDPDSVQEIKRITTSGNVKIFEIVLEQ